jgi:hypothetical protein
MADTTKEWVWVADRDWEVSAGHKCRRTYCRELSAAILWRRTQQGRRPWAYCSEHLYGRVIADGKVWVKVHRDSPIGKAATEIREDCCQENHG